MRHKQFSSAELEYRLERLIADRVYRQLEAARIDSTAVAHGVAHGRAKYIALRRPAKRSALRRLALINARATSEQE